MCLALVPTVIGSSILAVDRTRGGLSDAERYRDKDKEQPEWKYRNLGLGSRIAPYKYSVDRYKWVQFNFDLLVLEYNFRNQMHNLDAQEMDETLNILEINL